MFTLNPLATQKKKKIHKSRSTHNALKYFEHIKLTLDLEKVL